MDSIHYASTTYWVLFVDFLIAITTLLLFKRGGASPTQLGIVGLIFIALITGIHFGIGGQAVFPPDLSGGLFFIIILGGISVALALFFFTSSSIFDRLTQRELQLTQGLRVFVGGGFLMEGVLEVLPDWFAIMDGFAHIASGFFALVAAIAFAQKSSNSQTLLWVANIVGLVDIFALVICLCFVVWDDMGPYHNMNYVVFGAGPTVLWVHFVSINKLLYSKNKTNESIS